VLRLERGIVRFAAAAAGATGTGEQELSVELADGEHPALADVGLVGGCEVGDEVIVNVVARELGLGSGGSDIVHANLTRGLGAPRSAAEDVLKLNYTSLQHAIDPVDARAGKAAASKLVGAPVAVLALHGQLAAVAWACAGIRLGYVQTVGGALPGSHSRTVGELRARGLLADHITAGAAFGGSSGDAVTTAGALAYGFARLGWEAAVCGPGPGIVGSGSSLGHGGLVALDSAHTALALGAATVIVPRMSSADPRPEHRGLSHHTRSVIELLLVGAIVALPDGEPTPELCGHAHDWRERQVDLAGYAASGLPDEVMGRPLRDDGLFFSAALAGGVVLGELAVARGSAGDDAPASWPARR
jgi:hypothetical protein